MKRGEFTTKRKQLVEKAEKEYKSFRYRTLSKSRKKIFRTGGEIHFYSCLHEYFSYSEDMEEAHVEACLRCPEVIAALYEIYLKYEYLRYDRFEDIDELLNVLVREQEDIRRQKELE